MLSAECVKNPVNGFASLRYSALAGHESAAKVLSAEAWKKKRREWVCRFVWLSMQQSTQHSAGSASAPAFSLSTRRHSHSAAHGTSAQRLTTGAAWDCKRSTSDRDGRHGLCAIEDFESHFHHEPAIDRKSHHASSRFLERAAGWDSWWQARGP